MTAFNKAWKIIKNCPHNELRLANPEEVISNSHDYVALICLACGAKGYGDFEPNFRTD